MPKQVLDVQQMQHLQELGLDTSNASMLYCDLYDEEHILVESKHRFDKEENAIVLDGVRDSVIYCKKVAPAYTLQDVLDALPYSIGDDEGDVYWLQIEKMDMKNDDWRVSYLFFSQHKYFHCFQSQHLIDAAYELLCWCIEQGYVETNKNE